MPLTYIDEVVRFIEKNTAGVNIGTAGEEYVDPYTGASRYRAGGPTTAPASGYMDPYTGASRYTGTPASQPQAGQASTFMDPYTGASRYSSATAQPANQPSVPPVAKKVIPVVSNMTVNRFRVFTFHQTASVTFKQANVPAMRGKLYQFDDALRHEIVGP